MNRFFYKNFIFIFYFDVLFIVFSFYFSYLLRFNFSIPHEVFSSFQRLLLFVVIIKLLVFYFFDLYKGMWRYTSIGDLLNIIKASSVSTMAIISLMLFTHGFPGLARSIFVIDWLLTIALLSGSRLGIRLYFWLSENEGQGLLGGLRFLFNRHTISRGEKKLLIIGAGDCGEKIFREIRDNSRLKYHIIGFLDDDPEKVGMKIHGIPVLGSVEEIKPGPISSRLMKP